MSDMAITTNHEQRPCAGCGAVVTHARSEGIARGAISYRPVISHNGPCGLPCPYGSGGATIRARERATGERYDVCFHTANVCPRCKTPAEILAWRIDEIGREARRRVREELDEEEMWDEMEAADTENDRPLTEEEAHAVLVDAGIDPGEEWNRLLVRLAAGGTVTAMDVLALRKRDAEEDSPW